MEDLRIAVLDPAGEAKAISLPLAPRPATLAGKVVGFLNNGKPDFEYVYERLAELLQAECGVAAFVTRKKPTVSLPASRELLEELAESCDLIVNGIGD